jgi:hypothetical protein
MGMFDKDKEFGLDITDAFPLGEQFVLYAAEVRPDKIDTTYGKASKAVLTVARLKRGVPEAQFEVTTLASAIADKASEAEPSDFPCLVELRQVNSKTFGTTALVLQWCGNLDDADDPFKSADAPPEDAPTPAARRGARATAGAGK